jgi:catechol 2,3-dioxygenase-like lactoylglutathione lyase family enzyme
MLDHVRLMVRDVDRSRDFYEHALAPLGYRVWHESTPGLVGLGPRDATQEPLARIWLRQGEGSSTGTLISFTVQSRQLVETFHATALEAGGRDGGEPGVRVFHPTYYSAYIIDDDGATLEVVCHRPE